MTVEQSHPLEDLLLQLVQREAKLQEDRESAALERRRSAIRAREDWPRFKSRLAAEIAKANELFKRHQNGWSFSFADNEEAVGAIARGVLTLSLKPFGLVGERPVIMGFDGFVTFDSRRVGSRRLPTGATDADIQRVLSLMFSECQSLPWLQHQRVKGAEP